VGRSGLGIEAAQGLHPGRVAGHLGAGRPELDDRQVLMCLRDVDAALLADRPGLLLIAEEGYASAELDDYLHARGAGRLGASYRNRAPRPGLELPAPIRKLIESVHDTLEGQLDLELHGGRPSPA